MLFKNLSKQKKNSIFLMVVIIISQNLISWHLLVSCHKMKTCFIVVKKTIGITDIKFELEKRPFILCDVGGQRNERKKWEKSFEGVSVVIFVTSFNDYDLLCYEDNKTNRLVESLTLFEQIVNGEWFNKSLIMLIMNKIDLFQNKIKKVPLKNFYEDYDGGDDLDKAVAYLEKKFRALNKFEADRIFTFRSQATDSNTVKKILSDTTKTVIEYNTKKGVN